MTDTRTDFTIDEITLLVLQHSRRAKVNRKAAAAYRTAAEMLDEVAKEDDLLAGVYLQAGVRLRRQLEDKETQVNRKTILRGLLTLVLVSLVVFLMGSVAVVAEDVPVETASPTSEATDEPVITPTQPPVEQPTGVIYFTWTALAGLISTVLVVGIGGGAGGAVVIIRAVRQNDTIKFAMEKLYLSASPETQRIIRSTVTVAKEGVELVDEVTDGILPTVST